MNYTLGWGTLRIQRVQYKELEARLKGESEADIEADRSRREVEVSIGTEPRHACITDKYNYTVNFSVLKIFKIYLLMHQFPNYYWL